MQQEWGYIKSAEAVTRRPHPLTEMLTARVVTRVTAPVKHTVSFELDMFLLQVIRY